MTKIKKIFYLLRKLFFKLAIRLRFPLNKKIKVAGKNVHFHDIANSAIIEKIFLDGYESYEPELVKLFQNYPYKFNSFIDAGANIGFYSMLMKSHYGENVDVIAIEPMPNNIEYMQTIQQKNNLDFEILPYALFKEDHQEIPFYIPTTHRSSKLAPAASIINNFGKKGALFEKDKFIEIAVKTISFQSVLKKVKTPCLVKIDIEGAEFDALQNIKSILENSDDLDLVIELMINDKDKIEIFEYMKECGYQGYLITNAGLVKENRPLTLPYYNQMNGQLRTCWKNHFFTKRNEKDIQDFSLNAFGYFV